MKRVSRSVSFNGDVLTRRILGEPRYEPADPRRSIAVGPHVLAIVMRREDLIVGAPLRVCGDARGAVFMAIERSFEGG